MITKGFICRTAITTSLLISISACSLWNPHIDVDSKKRAEIYDAVAADCGNPGDPNSSRQGPYCEFHGSLPGGIAVSNELREKYYAAVGDQSKLKNGLALTLVPISAAALYLGISGGSSDVILALATAGATELGLGYYFSSEPRQKVYLSGSLAIGCAIVKTGPYLVTEPTYGKLSTDMSAERAAVLSAMNQTEGFRSRSSLTEIDENLAKAAIADAELALNEADATSVTALVVKGKIDQAGGDLIRSIDEIRDRVSQEILKTEPDVAAIRAIASGLGPNIRSTLSGLAPPKAAAATSGPEQSGPGGPQVTASSDDDVAKEMARLREDLVIKTVALRSKSLTLEPVLASIAAAEQKVSAIPACTVAAAEATAFSIDPVDETVSVAIGSVYRITVIGAFGMPTASVVGGSAPDGLLADVVPEGSTFTVVLTPKTEGTYTVRISDANQKNQKKIAVTVTKKAGT